MKPNLFYHVTESSSVPSILKEGLQPRLGPRSDVMEDAPAIFCFTSHEAMEDGVANWMTEEFDEEACLSLLVIDVTGLDYEIRNGVDWEACFTVPIPPDRITVQELP